MQCVVRYEARCNCKYETVSVTFVSFKLVYSINKFKVVGVFSFLRLVSYDLCMCTCADLIMLSV